MSVTAPTRYAWLSVAAAVAVLGLKLAAWRISGSVGLLSDALETLTNVGGATMALLMLRLAHQPPDDGHAYGHGKAEYFSSGFEGMLIFLAAGLIAFEALPRLIHPEPIESAGIGLAIAGLATVLNFIVARVLRGAARRYDSITLDADARHLMTDVWTTAGVIVGVGLVAATGWLRLDAVVALAVAVNVLWEGFHLIHEAAMGLMDAAWDEDEQMILKDVLDAFRAGGAPGQIEFHALRTRRAAARRFVEFHVLVPGAWSVQQGHDLIERIEEQLHERLSNLTVFTHLEPSDDPRSYGDEGLDRPTAA
ncbi:MAG: cation diffusion facilitator family transporter [Nevskia sp.]